ncbi:type VII secretion protein EccCa [Streptomyces sp. NPDC054841]
MPSTKVFRRPAFRPGPEMPTGEIAVQEPPVLEEPQGGALSSAMMYLPMALSSGMMMLMFIQPGSQALGYLVAGMMVISTLAMMVAQLVKASGDRKRKINGERRDYMRYLAQIRRQIRKAAEQQYTASLWRHPAPDGLWSVALSSRLWERRPSHDEFGEVRIGLGEQRAALRLRPPQSKPVEDLDPLAAVALRRFTKAHTVLPAMPTALFLRAFARVLVRADSESELAAGLEPGRAQEAARALARAMIAQLTTFHAPDDLWIAVCASAEARPHWDWVKWLPHAQHPVAQDAAGPVRMVTDNLVELERLLGEDFAERARFEPNGKIRPEEPFVLLVLDGVALSPGSRIADAGFANTTVLDVSGSLRWKADKLALRLRVSPEAVEVANADRAGRDQYALVGRPDLLSLVKATVLAKVISPNRIALSVDTADPLGTDQQLTELLGIGDAGSFEPVQMWASRTPWDRLRVPIGVGQDGTPVELDIKESAQGGMGPHGMLIGATGSGKSELLRTLVLALAATHSSEVLNFVLVDFKGGATFMGLERLSHTSAVITNLADELPLVDRMQDALQGELVRRQELLRANGFSSLAEYERARSAGTRLDPLPTLFLVVDEFSEMLSTRREMMDLFVMIGRLGRSLGVHLLLASQRLEEGRIHLLESHLSYRIGLRTFSASESRSVLGVPDAYELPSVPGSGYLKTGTAVLTRFKAAYVSGAYKGAVRRRSSAAVVKQQVVPYRTEYLALPQQPETEPEREAEAEETFGQETLMQVLLDRLRGQGPPARQVWLPPLADPASLDDLLPPLEPDPDLGLCPVSWAQRGKLQVPLGLVDMPFEGMRELLTADLSTGAGHVGIVGGPQSGKSTLLRSLIAALAITHTAREVQFYCLDFGGGALASLAHLPHMGSIAGRTESDRIARTIAELSALLVQREQLFVANGVESMEGYRRRRTEPWAAQDPFGDVFLVVDGWFTFRQEFEIHEPALQDLVNRGLSYGIHVVVTSGRWSEIRPWLRDVLGTRFELRLGDPVDSEVNARTAATVPEVPGRGLNRQGLHFLGALPRIDGGHGTEDLPDATRALADAVADAWQGHRAPVVRMLPAQLPADQLPAPDGDLRMPIGINQQDLKPAYHDFERDPHLMIIGDTESGKSNLLCLVARAIEERYGPREARVLLCDYRRDLASTVPEERRVGYAVSTESLAELAAGTAEALRPRMPGPEISPEQLGNRDWWEGPRVFVLVDDFELITGPGVVSPLAPLLEMLPQGEHIGLHLVVARSSVGAGRALADPVLRKMWDLGAPALLLSCPKDEGMFLGSVRPQVLPTGRAQLINRRRQVSIVQTALARWTDT